MKGIDQALTKIYQQIQSAPREQSLQKALTTRLLNVKKPGEEIAKLKLPFLNYSNNFKTIFDENIQFKAILHKARKSRSTKKIQTSTISTTMLQNFLNDKSKDQQISRCLALAVILCSRIQNIIIKNFDVKKYSTEFYEISFPTKTGNHAVLITNNIKKILTQHIDCKEKLTYNKVNLFCKRKFDQGTHICRKSSSCILKNQGNFKENQIQVYGNWKNNLSVLESHYLRSNSLELIARFWGSLVKQ